MRLDRERVLIGLEAAVTLTNFIDQPSVAAMTCTRVINGHDSSRTSNYWSNVKRDIRRYRPKRSSNEMEKKTKRNKVIDQ